MAICKMIVTEVTRYGELFCVAGFDPKNMMMIRPEPQGANQANEASRFWTAAHAGGTAPFAVGNIVSFDAAPPPASFPYPHATEDRIVADSGTITRLGRIESAELPAALGDSVSASLGAIFDDALVHADNGKAYVHKDATCASLGAITIGPQQLSFHVNDFDPARKKLRAWITDGDVDYDVSVTSDADIARWIAQGVDGLNAFWAGRPSIHVRLGLARPFPAQPDRCYLQINGLL